MKKNCGDRLRNNELSIRYWGRFCFRSRTKFSPSTSTLYRYFIMVIKIMCCLNVFVLQ